MERRGIPLSVAAAAGVRFDDCYGKRPAVLAAMRDEADRIRTLHGRYLHTRRGESKMLSIGSGDGVISVLGGWRAEPFIIVEGLFDVLSLAVCGFPAVAIVGCWSSWLPTVAAGRTIWLAFDACRPGEADVARYSPFFQQSVVRRLLPPTLCKDWNTALAKRGKSAVKLWLCQHTGIMR